VVLVTRRDHDSLRVTLPPLHFVRGIIEPVPVLHAVLQDPLEHLQLLVEGGRRAFVGRHGLNPRLDTRQGDAPDGQSLEEDSQIADVLQVAVSRTCLHPGTHHVNPELGCTTNQHALLVVFRERQFSAVRG